MIITKEKYIPTILREEDKKKREIAYGIGIRHKPCEFGMIHGPVEKEIEMLEVIGDSNQYIIRFNADHTDEILWEWIVGCWVKYKNII